MQGRGGALQLDGCLFSPTAVRSACSKPTQVLKVMPSSRSEAMG